MIDLSANPVLGKFEVVEALGAGAMAQVYKVRHGQLGNEYALKILDGGGGRMRDRMLREGRAQAGLRHPNVVAVHDVLDVDGQPALLLEYVDGPPLSRYILSNDPVDLDEVDQLAQGIIRGVRAVHSAGHLHRDLKPSNILLATHDDGYIPKIADFGLVKVFGDPGDPTRTKTGQLLGSPAYMSPEQTQSAQDLDPRTDVWALGAVLYQLVTGRLAFPHRDLVTVFSLIRSGEFRDPRSMRDRVPERMWNAILGAMTVDRDKRIADCDQLLAVWRGEAEHDVPVTVETFADGLPEFGHRAPTTVEVPLPKAPPAPEPPSKPAWVWPAVAAGLAVALALMVGFQLGKPDPARAALPDGAPSAQASVPEAPPVPRQPVPEPPRIASPAPIPEAPVPAPAPPIRTAVPRAPAPTARNTRAAAAPADETTPPPEPTPTGPEDPVPSSSSSPEDPGTTSSPEAPSHGTFRFTGDAERVWLVRNGTHFDAGPVTPGTYTLAARFPGRPLGPIAGVTVEVRPGETITIDCKAGFFTCRPTP